MLKVGQIIKDLTNYKTQIQYSHLWTCNDLYSAYYFPSTTTDKHYGLGSGVATLAKDPIKI